MSQKGYFWNVCDKCCQMGEIKQILVLLGILGILIKDDLKYMSWYDYFIMFSGNIIRMWR